MYELIGKNDITKIDAATMEVLERTGILVEREAVLDLLEEAGANVNKKEKIAKIPESLVKMRPAVSICFHVRGRNIQLEETTL